MAKNSTNHWIMKVEDTLNNHVTRSRYFDGTQAQAIKFFNGTKEFKEFKNKDRYLISMRANSIILSGGDDA